MKKQELNYYDEFIKNAEIACKMSTMLKEYTENFDEEKSEIFEKKIHQYENEADDNLHLILSYLVKDFLPPIDREDIVNLSNLIDDMIDCIDELVISIDILDIKTLKNDFLDFVNLIEDMCEKQAEIVKFLKQKNKYEDIHLKVVNINNLEENGDRLFEKAIYNLFKNEINPIEVLKWNTMYNCAEKCFDSIENVANSIEEIVMKNL